ncbi:MAG TPA: hypothetical protein VG328_04050 [Stellaceae bacterium]|nr:hypothetical protein [Stellaceae bacterium]
MTRDPAALAGQYLAGAEGWCFLHRLDGRGIDRRIAERFGTPPVSQRRLGLAARLVAFRDLVTDDQSRRFVARDCRFRLRGGRGAAPDRALCDAHEKRADKTMNAEFEHAPFESRRKQIAESEPITARGLLIEPVRGKTVRFAPQFSDA